jgi:uncharacterized protein (UPF0333 family)
MKKLLTVSIVFLVFISGCAFLLGGNLDSLKDYNVFGLTKNGIKEEYGFDRILMMNLVIVDKTGTFNTDNNIVNVHFDNGNSSAYPEDEEGKWVHKEEYNQYEGLLIAQAKYDQVQLDFVSIGTGSSSRIERVDVAIKRLFSTQKAHLNHLGTLVLSLESEKKSGVEYGYKTTIRKSDVFVQINFVKPTEEIFDENLNALKKHYPETYKSFGNSINKCY